MPKNNAYSKLKLGRIGFGTWRLLDNTSEKEAFNLLQEAVTAGITFFDTAQVYSEGRAERLLGELKNTYPHITVATKLPGCRKPGPHCAPTDVYPRGYLERMILKSLMNLNLDTIDVLQLHNWSFEWDLKSCGYIFDILRKFKEDGMVRRTGISMPNSGRVSINFDNRVVDFVQFPINLAQKWGLAFLQAIPSNTHLKFLARGVFAHGLLSYHKLADKRRGQEKILSYIANELDISLEEVPRYAFFHTLTNTNIYLSILGINSEYSLLLIQKYLSEGFDCETLNRVKQIDFNKLNRFL